MSCVFCERPLLCEACDVEFVPSNREQFEALSRREVPVICPTCETILVCRWCHFAYDGDVDE